MDGLFVDDILIRAARVEDTDAVAALWKRLVDYHRELDRDLPPATVDGPQRYARSLAERIGDTHTRTFVAEANGRIVGYVLGVMVDFVPEMFEQELSGFLADIFVDEAYRRAGVGRALVAKLTDWFRSRGVDYFEWHVAARNAEGVKFWQALGGRDVMLRMRADLKRGDDDK